MIGFIFVLILVEVIPIIILISIIREYREEIKSGGLDEYYNKKVFIKNLFVVGVFMLVGIVLAIKAV